MLDFPPLDENNLFETKRRRNNFYENLRKQSRVIGQREIFIGGENEDLDRYSPNNHFIERL